MLRHTMVEVSLHYLPLMRTNRRWHRFQATTKKCLTLRGGLASHTLQQVMDGFTTKLA